MFEDRGEVEVGVGLHALVEVDDVQYVEQLPLVLMQPLHLYVKEGVGVEDEQMPSLRRGSCRTAKRFLLSE